MNRLAAGPNFARGHPRYLSDPALESLADHRNVQPTTDHRSNLPKRDSFFRDRVISDPHVDPFKGEPVYSGGIEPVCYRPAVQPVADIRRNTFLARQADEDRNEAVISIAVDRWLASPRRLWHALGYGSFESLI